MSKLESAEYTERYKFLQKLEQAGGERRAIGLIRARDTAQFRAGALAALEELDKYADSKGMPRSALPVMLALRIDAGDWP